MTPHNYISKYRHLINWLGTCLGTERRHWQTRQIESLQNWKEVNVGSSACLVNWLGTCYGIVTQGPVSIVAKLYQFHIVTVVELRSVSLTTLSFVLWLIVVSTASSVHQSSQQRQTRLQDISDSKAICSQLETLEMRAIIYNFILYWDWASVASEANTLLYSHWHFCIREYGNTLYVGLERAVSPTNTNFRLTFLLTWHQEALYEDLAV